MYLFKGQKVYSAFGANKIFAISNCTKSGEAITVTEDGIVEFALNTVDERAIITVV